MQTQDTASEICNLVDKNNDLIRRNEKLESLKKMFFEASEKQSVTISDYEGKITMLQEKKDKLEDLNKVYLRACTMHENELAGGRAEITTLKEENARLKATVARGGSSSDAKNLKTVNNNLMHQNAELSKENKELKQQHKEDAKKVKDSLKRVQDSTPSMKQVEEYKEYSKLAGQRLHQCKHDYNRMRMLKEDVEKELNDAKKAGADKTLAKTLKNLEDKVFSQDNIIKVLKNDAKKFGKTNASADEQVDKFRTALQSMRDEFLSLTSGVPPKTRIPDEDAGPDSGGEEHMNLDGRKRARGWCIEKEDGCPY